ncbi:uncharacterized protein LOC114788884 isoform X2 [Denticeps clupeoides]|uniref:Uncharacterized protein n=1 Tax=Denticeps clupeoides TaxID=299321 RepID=A0AAY4A680_9TELE|nr:uncharacterized protein LOC114788884 isoform X2 [Denticeps clupeoides]
MPRVAPGLEYETLAECTYFFPDEVLADVRSVTAAYTELHLHVDFYLYPNNEKKRLVYLAGTIPIPHEGILYNIPVSIWIHESHPQSPPKCYVCPSSSMVINANSSCVDTSGHVHLHCLNNWKIGWSSLSLVLEEMRAAFQRETPLFSTYPLAQAPTHPPSSSSSSQGPSSTYNCWPCSSSGLFLQNPALAQPSGNSVSISAKSTQSPSSSEAIESGAKRSYTQELLDMGITFGETGTQSTQSTNPFLTSPPAPSTTPSSLEDLDNLFQSLQLEKVINMYHLGTKDSDALQSRKGSDELSAEVGGLVENRQSVLVDHLPASISPSKIKNKLTIYFQRRQNGGDAQQVLRQSERVFTVSEQHFPIQVKTCNHSQIQVPAGVVGEKADMYRSLLTLEGRSFSPADVLEAVQAFQDLPSALKYLSHECPICQEHVCFSKIITMTHCSCAFCENCFKAYFSSVIKEKSIVHAVCPLCNKPDVRGAHGTEESAEYFSLLDTKIRHYLDPQIHELFQSKLRDQALQEMPNFRWCAHCCFGVLHEADRLRMDCPSCGKSTCFKCKNPWAPQHEGVSCEKFKEWVLHNSPEFQNARLENLLSRNKIDCPKCKFRFYLSKGGCLHFKCTQCEYEFCGGCGRPFLLGTACSFSTECGVKGLHAHHPRDCLYHLRDWSVQRLQRLLQLYKVSHPLLLQLTHGAEARNWRGVCGVLEHKEMSGVKEEPCGRPALLEYRGYCMLHYKECLVELINQKCLDPAVLFDTPEIVTELQRWRILFPQQQAQEPDQHYKERLRQLLTEKVRLARGSFHGAVRGESLPSFSQRPPRSAAPDNPARGLPEDAQLLLLLNN